MSGGHWLRWHWYDLSGDWERLREIARARDEQKRGYASSRYWNDGSHFIGLLGERTYSLHTGLPPDLRLRASGWALPDFPGGVEVKAVSGRYWTDPYLKHPHKGPWTAVWFVLVAIDEQLREGAVCGRVARDVLRGAPLRDWGHGPQHSLHFSALEPVRPAQGRGHGQNPPAQEAAGR